jgi:hypothetical protein
MTIQMAPEVPHVIERILDLPGLIGKKSHFLSHRMTRPAPQRHYSITRSARSSSEGGIVRPSALAVFRLTSRSNVRQWWCDRQAEALHE